MLKYSSVLRISIELPRRLRLTARKFSTAASATASFQVGANVGETVAVNFSTGLGAGQIGQIATASGTQVTNAALTEGGLTSPGWIGSGTAVGQSTAGTGAGQSAESAYAKAQAINAAGVSGLTVTAANSQTVAFATVAAETDYSLTVNGATDVRQLRRCY